PTSSPGWPRSPTWQGLIWMRPSAPSTAPVVLDAARWSACAATQRSRRFLNSSPRGASCQLAGIDDAVRRSWQLRPRGAGRNELCTGSNQPMDLTRRNFLQASLASTLIPALARAADRDAPRILLRSSWQIVNIGDIAHTPGVLALIERYLPEAEVRLWASNDL